jgi:chromosome segregation ATPase
MLLFTALPVVAQTAPPDSPIAQAVLVEIRQLRNDPQTTAATIQRVQIVMYRLQSQASVPDHVTQRLDQARAACDQAETQRNMFTTRVEQAEAAMRNPQNGANRAVQEEMLSNLKSSVEALAAEEQQCQLERAEAENQLRAEQAKMDDLQDRLDKLDLAEYGLK